MWTLSMFHVEAPQSSCCRLLKFVEVDYGLLEVQVWIMGYSCVYIPDSISPTRVGHLVGTGASGADAEKQAWLAKYATGPSAEPSAPGVLSVDQISAILRDQFGILPKRRRSAIPSRTQVIMT